MGLSPDALYSAVYLDVSQYVIRDFAIPPRPDVSYKQFVSTYLLNSVIRKWIPKDSREADRAALDAFTAANNRCKDWSFTPNREVDRVILGETQRILFDFLHPGGEFLVQSYYDLLSHGRPGPGATVGSRHTSYYGKYFDSTLTSTSEYLYDEYRSYCEWIPFLADAECQRYAKFGPPRIVSGSKCSFVPKTSRTSRMICVEPSLNMFFQLGLAHILEKRLKSFFGIDLSSQPEYNMQLARLGSIDGSFATIDLSSASDSVSLRLCELLFPKWFFELLLTLRSHSTQINGKPVPLFMISTMGNGFTFPLQTIIFSALLLAVRNTFSVSRDARWSVFGDDIVCGKEIFSPLCHYLELFGFITNKEKTFFEGPFRESCGADWLNGQPVRPIFLRKLDHPHDYTVAINQLNEWTAYTGIPLQGTVALLFSQLEPGRKNPVPFVENNDAGIRVPLTLCRPSYDSNQSFVYKTWERRPTKYQILEGTIRGTGRLRNLGWNPSGLYVSFLFGELVNYTISVRHDRVLYRKKLRHSPFWDYAPLDRITNGVVLSWQQWETAVDINLSKSWGKPQPRA